MREAPRYEGLFGRDTRTPDSFWISLRYFNFYRMALAALFLGITLYFDDALNLGSYRLNLFRLVCVAYLMAGVVFHSLLRNLKDLFNLQLSAHMALDIVAMTLLMYASGGIRSGLGVMLLIALTGAALVAPRRLALLYASLAAIALLLEQSYWVLRFDAPEANYLQPGLLAIGCFASAGVTSWLAQRVAANERLARERGRALETQLRVNQLVIADMQDGVLVLDREGRVAQHNRQAQRLLGVESLQGAQLADLLPGFGERWRTWREGERAAAQSDLELRGRGLRLRLMEAGAAEDLALLFVEDTTRSRTEAQQLKLAALGRLTANIAHEIRNPLSAISHAAELLDEEQRGSDRERLTRIIHDNTRRLERLVTDVMQLNRRDRATADRVALNGWLAAFVADFAANEALPAERFGLETGREVQIVFDREHLRQVLWNLLRNAVRHARRAPRSVRIVLSAYADQVELNVIDDGPGVPRASQGQLFEPFFTTESKGTGLGLYLARELCAANRATLEYVDDMQGAHFRILCREAPGA
ncbi:MAG: PAS domain-containing protein [Betaproteobacteria bacterium]|nr:PAS domain-containing protein [Betaproteobacteria bacterium]